jgi:hypothetical protein
MWTTATIEMVFKGNLNDTKRSIAMVVCHFDLILLTM